MKQTTKSSPTLFTKYAVKEVFNLLFHNCKKA